MVTPQFKKELRQLGDILMTMLLIILPAIIAYYVCRDYRGRGNSPEHAPLAAAVVLFILPPFYFSIRQLYATQKIYLNVFFLAVFIFLVIQVTILNSKFYG